MPAFSESPVPAPAPPAVEGGVADPRGAAPRVVVLVRPGCHLCEAALEVVARVCREVGAPYATRDITDDAELTRLYTNEIPVTFVDGRQHDFWRVDEARLRAALARGSEQSAPSGRRH